MICKPVFISIRLAAMVCAAFLALLSVSYAQTSQGPVFESLNKPKRLDWFRDQGFGIFIHWSADGQLGTVISHSLPGASADYTQSDS